MELDATDLTAICQLVEVLGEWAEGTPAGEGYHLNNAEIWYEGDFLGRLNMSRDGEYKFSPAE